MNTNDHMPEVGIPPGGYILCGGQSRRFGSDKARQLIDDHPLITHVARQLDPACGNVWAIADRPDKYQDLGLSTLADLRPGQGPLGGLHTALAHAAERGTSPWIVLASCDQTRIEPVWLSLFRELLADQPQARAVLFRETSAFRKSPYLWHPFPGMYHIDLLPRVNAQLERGERALQAFLASLRDLLVAVPLPADWPAIPQINTPVELALWQIGRASCRERV